jgi:hypothetical protein
MALPNNTLSTTPIVAPFMAPRTTLRFNRKAGATDVHPGGIHLGDASQGLNYQVWQARTDGTNIYLSAPNTPEFVQLSNTSAVWVSLAFDQNARPFIGYVNQSGQAFFYWFSTLVNQFVTTQLPTTGLYDRIFSAVDDLRPLNISASDIILVYVRGTTLYMRVQRDRFNVEYTLGTVPWGKLVQVYMNTHYRFQFAFQAVQQGQDSPLPPGEWNPALGLNEPA